jgi:hypothetical protein
VETAIPGDVSSATFWAVAAAALPGSDLEIVDLGLNPSRTALFGILSRAGADVQVDVDRVAEGEPRGRVRVRHRGLRPLVLAPAEVPGVIDELPALAAMAACGGELHVTGAGELRVKESDRISALAAGFRGDGRRDRGVPRRLPRARRSPPHRRTPGRRRRSPPGDGLCDRRPLGDRRHHRRWRRGRWTSPTPASSRRWPR